MIDSRREEGGVAGSMALLSTLSAAVDLVRAMRERREGRDPSEQQVPEVVLPSLQADLRAVEDRLMALRSSLVAAEGEAQRRVVLVRRMSDVILLGRIGRDLHAVHQRLMSLYPRVDEGLVEDARRLHRACGELLDEDAARTEQVVAFIDDAAAFAKSTAGVLQLN